MSTRSFRWHPNALILPHGAGVLRIFQPDARRNILATLPLLTLADALADRFLPRGELEALYGRLGEELKIVEATEFTLFDHALRNSDLCGDLEVQAGSLECMPFEEFLEMLLEAAILTETWPPADEFRKRGFTDRYRGSFNEQIATECLFNRLSPSDWWARQKFTPDARDTRPTPYKFIQEKFLDAYFKTNLPGRTVLEIGCGTGYQTSKMAAHALKAVGVDYNQAYLEIARTRWPQDIYSNLHFEYYDITDLRHREREQLSRQAERYDFIFMIDIFLFVFDEVFQPQLFQHRADILPNIGHLLAPNGVLVIMDPHFFWHTPWIGSETRPVGIISEYNHRRFKGIPPLREYMDLFHAADFQLRRFYEPEIDTDYRAIDPQAYAFMAEFPQWLVWELVSCR